MNAVWFTICVWRNTGIPKKIWKYFQINERIQLWIIDEKCKSCSNSICNLVFFSLRGIYWRSWIGCHFFGTPSISNRWQFIVHCLEQKSIVVPLFNNMVTVPQTGQVESKLIRFSHTASTYFQNSFTDITCRNFANTRPLQMTYTVKWSALE